MPNTLTSTPVRPASTLDIPADTENVDSASVAEYVQPLFDADAYLVSKVLGAGGLQSLPISITRALPQGSWAFSFLGPPAVPVLETTSSSATYFLIPLDGIPSVGLFLRTYQMLFLPTTGHGALPANMPKLEVISIPDSLGASVSGMAAATVLDFVVDSSVNVAAYEKVHSVFKAVSATIDLSDPTQLYFMRVNAESGTNAAGGLSAWKLLLGVSA